MIILQLFIEFINTENLILESFIALKDSKSYKLEILTLKINEIWKDQTDIWSEEYWY